MSFKIIRNNIIDVTADAIVNTANPKPTFGSGVDSAIYKAAGENKLLKERKKIGDIEVGKAVSTPAFNLSAKYIIHTVGPAWQGGNSGEREAVKSCYMESLKLAKKLDCESIAFPLIATGIYGFPKADALQIAISVFSEFLAKTDMEIILVVFDKASFVLSDKIFSNVGTYIDDNYVEIHENIEYSDEDVRRTALLFEDETRTESGDRTEKIPKVLRRESKQKDDNVKAKRIFGNASGALRGSAPGSAKESLFSQLNKSSLDDRVAHIADTWQECLLRLIDEKGYSDTEVYKRANLNRKLFSKIRCNANYQPKKITAVAFALALKLNLDEAKDFLGRAGYAFSPSSLFDLIVEYFIEQEVYDIFTINCALFEHDQPMLGD